MDVENNRGLINIVSDGLDEDLERVLYAIIENAQIKANEEGFSALLGEDMPDREHDYTYGNTCMASSTVSFYQTCGSFASGQVWPVSGEQVHGNSFKPKKLDIKKNLKAEAKACELISDLIGDEQAVVYKKTKRIITKPGKFFWIVGNVFQDRIYHDPFDGKPDVVRLDNEKKLYYTSFCVDQLIRERTPYTDKVISFATNLILNEKEFKKTINRISEGKFNSIKECALWEFK